MGATSWRDNILQALLIVLVVQIIAYALCVFCAFLWASWKERMARPPTRDISRLPCQINSESMAESDVEMGTVNVGEGVTILDNPPHGLAANSAVGDDGKLEDNEDVANTRASTPEIPTSTYHPPKAQCKNVTEDVKRRVTVPVVVDVSLPQQVGKELAGKEA